MNPRGQHWAQTGSGSPPGPRTGERTGHGVAWVRGGREETGPRGFGAGEPDPGSRQDGARASGSRSAPARAETGGARGAFTRAPPADARASAARMCARRNGSGIGGVQRKGLSRSCWHIPSGRDGADRPGARSSAAPARYAVALAGRATQGGPAGEGRSARQHQPAADVRDPIPLQDIMIGRTSRPLPPANRLVSRNAPTGEIARFGLSAAKSPTLSIVDLFARARLAGAPALPRVPVLGCLVRRVRTPRPPPQPVSVTAILLTPAPAGMNPPDLKWISSRIRIPSRPAGACGPWPPLRPVPGRRASPGSCARDSSPW